MQSSIKIGIYTDILFDFQLTVKGLCFAADSQPVGQLAAIHSVRQGGGQAVEKRRKGFSN